MLAIAIKDLRLLVRDRMNCFFTFVFPVLIAVLFGLIFSGGGDAEKSGVPVAVVNEDGRAGANELIEDMKKDSALEVTIVASREEGEALVRKGTASACVIVPKGYSSTTFFSGSSTSMEVIADPSRKAETGLLQGKLTQLAFQGTGRVFGDRTRMLGALEDSRARVNASSGLTPEQRGAFEEMFKSADALQSQLDVGGDGAGTDDGEKAGSSGVGWNPVKITVHELEARRASSGPRSSFQISFGQGVVWGLVGCVGAFVSSFAAERQQGTLGRLLCSPLAPWRILAGKALACFITCMIVQTILLVSVMGIARVFEHRAFEVQNFVFLAVAFGAASAAFTGIMMAFACLSKSEAGGAGLARAVMLVLAIIGGGSVPLFMLPKWMQTVSGISPCRWTVLAIDGAVWRGMSLRELALPVGILVGVGVVGSVIGAMSVRRLRAA